MKSKFVFTVILIAAVLVAPVVFGEPIALKPGTVEGRIQTSSAFWTGNFMYGSMSPGIHFWIEEEFFIISLQGGFAYFFSPNAALGSDLSLTAAGGGGSLVMVGVAPFFKYVYKSFFVEPALGFSILSGSGGGDSITIFQTELWLGAQLSITDSTAFLLGPYFSYAYLIDAEEGTAVTGLRLGVSFFRF
jgi:hypothetical protein